MRLVFKRDLRALYGNRVLPALRGSATPCFRLAVGAARLLGVLPRSRAVRKEYFLIVHITPHVGDNVMLLPMFEALREAHPQARIECVVQSPIDAFMSLVPGIDRVYAVNLGHGPTESLRLEAQRFFSLFRFYWTAMRHMQPGVCIIPRVGCGFRDLMLAYLMQAPKRVGFSAAAFDRSHPPAGYRDSLLTHPVPGGHGMQDPARFLYLLKEAGLVPTTQPTAIGAKPNTSLCRVADTVDWTSLAARLGISPAARLAVIAPGATAAKKIWPVERWARVLADLHLRGFTVVLLSGGQDAEIARHLYQLTADQLRSQTILVAGITSLPESAKLLSHASLFIGNDSGPGHLAGALGVPCVILYIAAEGSDPEAPFAPERVRPMGSSVVCCRPAQTISPCEEYCRADSAHCITQIELDTVLRAIDSLLHASSRVFV